MRGIWRQRGASVQHHSVLNTGGNIRGAACTVSAVCARAREASSAAVRQKREPPTELVLARELRQEREPLVVLDLEPTGSQEQEPRLERGLESARQQERELLAELELG